MEREGGSWTIGPDTGDRFHFLSDDKWSAVQTRQRAHHGGLGTAEVAALRTRVAAVPDQSTDPEVWGELIEISDALEGYRIEAEREG